MTELLGRMHPIVVHMPIGILLLAGVVGLFSKNEKFAAYQKALQLTYCAGTIFAAIAVATGLNLSSKASYEEENLFLHQWLGIATTLIGLLLWWMSTRNRSWLLNVSLHIALLLTLILTGHLGGRMTHGPGYLSGGLATQQLKREINDSTAIFHDLVFPVLQNKCVRCHQQNALNGGLDLSSAESIMHTISGEAVVEPGNPLKSELFKRVALPPNHPKYMPPNGPALSFQEVKLIEWWVELGAPLDIKIGALPQTPEVQKFLEHQFGLIPTAKDPLAHISAPSLPIGLLDSLGGSGLVFKTISIGSNLIEVIPSKAGQEMAEAQLNRLLLVKDQVVWLNLPGANLHDESLKIIGQLTNLRKLRLERNPISDEGLRHLENLKNLEYLNLFGTGIGDKGIQPLIQLTNLKDLFIGQTAVTESGIARLKASNKLLRITGEISAE